MGTKYPIESGSTIRIILPNDLKFGDLDLARTKSTTDGLADLSSVNNFEVVDDREIIVRRAFLKEKAPD
jgi:hypothetical protein